MRRTPWPLPAVLLVPLLTLLATPCGARGAELTLLSGDTLHGVIVTVTEDVVVLEHPDLGRLRVFRARIVGALGGHGMKLDADGGIAIYIAAERREDVPEEEWLPLERGDYGI